MARSMYRIWCDREMPAKFVALLAGEAEAVGPGGEDSGGALAAWSGAHGIVAAARRRYDGALMDQIPTLRVIARLGIGLDNVSVPDASARGIAVCNAPDAPTISTAEHALALILAAARRLNKWQRAAREGGSRDCFGEYDGLELHGLRLGLIGLGRIGRRVARAALALDMAVVAYDPAVAPEQASALGVELAPTLETVLRTADVVSLHLPLTAETRHLMDEERLNQMKSGSVLVNAARGGLVDEAALLRALASGRLHGAGLDVFESEPPSPDHPLLGRDDVIATPHIASATPAGKDRLWTAALTQVLQVLRGERPAHLVNPEVWPGVEPTRPA